MHPWLKANLVCPRDLQALAHEGDELRCTEGHTYPVIDGIPVMLLDDVSHTHEVAARNTFDLVSSYRQAPSSSAAGQETVAEPEAGEIHPYVNSIVANTCGQLYKSLVGNLPRYPIPEIDLPQGDGGILLDVGCSWGRWCIAAGRKGYTPVGIDPKLVAIMAAREVSRQFGVSGIYLVADARYMPFRTATFPLVHSFGVLQHFNKENVRKALENIARVLEPDGTSLIQMPNLYGIRSFYNHMRRGFREAEAFGVRYWSVPELEEAFSSTIGPSSLSVAAFFGLGAQRSDRDLLPWRNRMVVSASEFLRALSRRARWMRYFADSVYVHSRRETDA